MEWYDIILWILIILSIATGTWYLFGNSPTFEQTILMFILTIVFGIAVKITRTETRLANLEKSFYHLADDFKKYSGKKK